MELNKYIDHTLLRPDAIAEDIERLCREAAEYQFRSVVVNPIHVEYAAGLLEKTDIGLCSVAGFPLGATFPEIKTAEAIAAEKAGANEIDVVANIGRLQQGNYRAVTAELANIRRKLSDRTILKVIIETPLLSPERWEKTVAAIIDSGADFVKTGTGFFGAVSRQHVQQLKNYCGDNIKIKAAGGICTAADASTLILAGADRLGCSASVAIMNSLKSPNM